MENTQTITPYIPPSLDGNKPLKSEKKPVKTILDVKERLPKVNRTITCTCCKEEKILNPEQYQAYYDYWGTTEKIEKEFICKPCEMLRKENPFKFEYTHSEFIDKFKKDVRRFFLEWRDVSKRNNALIGLQTLLEQSSIKDPNFEVVMQNGIPNGMRIRNIPFVGNIEFFI